MCSLKTVQGNVLMSAIDVDDIVLLGEDYHRGWSVIYIQMMERYLHSIVTGEHMCAGFEVYRYMCRPAGMTARCV